MFATGGRRVYTDNSCADTEGGAEVPDPPPPSHEKSQNIGFLSNTGPDPLNKSQSYQASVNVVPSSACQGNAIQMLLVLFGSSLPSSELDPFSQNFLDPRI